MDAELVQPVIVGPVADAVKGYSRATVDEFLASAAAERVRLEAALAEAKARQAGSRSVIGMHRVMISMLIETQEELHARRREAEAAAEELLRRADREAEAILAAVPQRPDAVIEPEPRRDVQIVAVAPVTPITSVPGSGRTDAVAIDLTEEHRRGSDSHTSNGAAWHREPVFSAANGAGGSSEEYFMFLRGALVDEDPLGPRFE